MAVLKEGRYRKWLSLLISLLDLTLLFPVVSVSPSSFIRAGRTDWSSSVLDLCSVNTQCLYIMMYNYDMYSKLDTHNKTSTRLELLLIIKENF